MKTKWFIVGGLILVEILLCVGILLISWQGLSRFTTGEFRLRLLHIDRVSAEQAQEWRFRVDGAVALDVQSSAGNVEITTGEVGEVLIVANKTAWDSSQERAEAALEKMELTVTQNGNLISVRFRETPKVLVVGNTKLDKVDFTIRVPEETNVSVSNQVGKISLAGILGDADLRTEFDKIDIHDLGGALKASTNSGAITARSIEAGEAAISLEAEFGDVTLEEAAAGKIEVLSNSGVIRLKAVRAENLVYLHSEFGGVTFEEGGAGELKVESNSGKVRLSGLSVKSALIVQNEFGDIFLTSVSAVSYDLDSNSGSISLVGAVGSIKAHSEFGGIEITGAEAADLGLESNSGSIEFSGSLGGGPHTLKTEFGNIHLALPEESRLTVDLQTEFGQIKSAFEVTLSGELKQGHWCGDINGGGAILTASTNNGNISLEIFNP